MTLISDASAPLGATAEAVDVSTGHTIASGAGYALIIYSRDFSEWNSPATNYTKMEPWIAAIIHRLATFTTGQAAIPDETANITVGAATIATGTRDGVLKERENRTIQIFGSAITSTLVDPDVL